MWNGCQGRDNEMASHRASILKADGRLITMSREASKPRDCVFKLSYRSEIWQTPRKHCCRDACQISERSDNSKPISRGFEISWDVVVRRSSAYWIEALVSITALSCVNCWVIPEMCIGNTTYECFVARNRYLGQGRVITSHEKLWDVITSPCHRYQLLAPRSSNMFTRCKPCFRASIGNLWYISQMIFHSQFECDENFNPLEFIRSPGSDHNKFLHSTRQLCCRVVCKKMVSLVR